LYGFSSIYFPTANEHEAGEIISGANVAYVDNAVDKFVWKVALEDGKLKFRVYRNMSGEYWGLTAYPEQEMILADFNAPNTCPVYNVKFITSGSLDYRLDSLVNVPDQRAMNLQSYDNLNSGVGEFTWYQWKEMSCEIRAV
jgi:hypothetical protein